MRTSRLNTKELRDLDTWFSTPKLVKFRYGLEARRAKLSARTSGSAPIRRDVEGSDQEAAVQFEDRP